MGNGGAWVSESGHDEPRIFFDEPAFFFAERIESWWTNLDIPKIF
jgi:hypothetical protein